MRKTFVITTLVIVLALSTVLAALAGGIIQISSDPYSNTSSQHQTQVEPDTYAWGNTVVSDFQTGRFTDGGSSNICWATSQNSGATWINGCLPSLTIYSNPPGTYSRASDPVVAYDAEHNVWLLSALAMTGSTGAAVTVSRSTDGGLTWGAPVVVSSAGGGFYDKNWISCDNWSGSPYFGNCYVTWDDYGFGNRLYTSTSTDGGLTWGPRRTTGNSAAGIGAQPLAQPNGRVIVPVSDAFGFQLRVYGSTNGGNSWTRTRNIATFNSHTVAGGLRAPTYLVSAEIDAAGKIYVVWADCRFRSGCSSNDIVMITSTNGTTWTSPVRIPIDATNSGVDHFIPGLAVDRNTSGSTARLGLTYYYYPNASCNSSTCQLHVGFISSADGGATWSAPQTLAGPMTLSWLANTTSGRMVGDYISTSFAGTSAVGVFANAFAPSGGVFAEHSYAHQTTVAADQPYPLAVTDDPVLYYAPQPSAAPLYTP
ncbi:MAG: sialidase family protein [Chloroflexota bacterium]